MRTGFPCGVRVQIGDDIRQRLRQGRGLLVPGVCVPRRTFMAQAGPGDPRPENQHPDEQHSGGCRT